jgi:spore coat polysaccharide biosynthesis predicted glycosyltransferase SpsG
VARRLGGMGAVLNLGWHNILSTDGISQVFAKLLQSLKIRRNLTQKAQSLVDSEGGIRVRKELILN